MCLDSRPGRRSGNSPNKSPMKKAVVSVRETVVGDANAKHAMPYPIHQSSLPQTQDASYGCG